jgi:hypothetical protein
MKSRRRAGNSGPSALWRLEGKFQTEGEHENHAASIWKTESLSSYAQAQTGSVFFALVESIRGG